VDTTKFEGSNVTHVWNDDGASTVLGDGSNGSLSKGYNNFYRVVAPATVMITNEDSDSLKAENNWWDYTGCDSLAPPDNRFVGPVDPFPRRCSEGSLMRRVGDISGDFGDGAGIAGRALRLIVLPNPLAASAMIRYEVPGSQAMSRSVDLSIYDVRGNRVSSPVHRRQETGVYELRWCETASDGSTIPAGIYFVRLTVDGEVRTAKVVVVR
jgi:hypothetical protein